MKTALIATCLLLAATPAATHAQSVIPGTQGVGPTVVAPTGSKSTENLSVTTGSRTSLSVGNTTSFGSNVSLTLSTGLSGVSRSVLVPKEVAITSNIGSVGSSPGVTRINISNLTAKGGGNITPGSSSGAGGSVINSEDGQYASGDATIDGMSSTVKMDIGGASPGNSQVGFYTIVHPHIKPYDTRSVQKTEMQTTTTTDADGNVVTTTQPVVVTTTEQMPGTGACEPTPGNPCIYVAPTDIVSGNASAGASLTTNTNIDIQANSFTNTFAQSF